MSDGLSTMGVGLIIGGDGLPYSGQTLILFIPSVANAETSDVHAADPTAGQG